MKKIKSMRIASAVFVGVLLTSCVVSGTYAKYATSSNGSDTARVAYWGFTSDENSIAINDLFSSSYLNDSDETTVSSAVDVIAPGTSGSATFSFTYNGAGSAEGPEVAYTFSVAATGTCDEKIKANPNIQWKLDDGTWGDFDTVIAAIKALSGDASGSKDYAAKTLPDACKADQQEHTISWRWTFSTTETQDAADTAMGNTETLEKVSITITVTATQRD